PIALSYLIEIRHRSTTGPARGAAFKLGACRSRRLAQSGLVIASIEVSTGRAGRANAEKVAGCRQQRQLEAVPMNKSKEDDAPDIAMLERDFRETEIRALREQGVPEDEIPTRVERAIERMKQLPGGDFYK